jgi:RimJ/RimL family protein N-acetyltransferase
LEELFKSVATEDPARRKTFRLLFISKKEDQHKHLELMINDGTLVGVFDFSVGSHDRSTRVGVLIHHKFTRNHYAKEAFIAVLDYVVLGHPTKGHNGNLSGLGFDRVVLETEVANLAFKRLIQSLLLDRERTPDRQPLALRNKTMIYTIGKRDWEAARPHIKVEWMSPPHIALSRERNPSFDLFGDDHRHQSKH